MALSDPFGFFLPESDLEPPTNKRQPEPPQNPLSGCFWRLLSVVLTLLAFYVAYLVMVGGVKSVWGVAVKAGS